MHFTTIAELYYRDQKTQECGMRWAAATIKWGNQMKRRDVMFGLRIVKTEKA